MCVRIQSNLWNTKRSNSLVSIDGQCHLRSTDMKFRKCVSTSPLAFMDCKDNCLWDNIKANGDLDLEPKVIGNLGGNVTYIPVGKLEYNQAMKK